MEFVVAHVIAPNHLIMLTVAAVHADGRTLVAVLLRAGIGTAQCLGPAGRQALCVIRVIAVAEGVRDHVVLKRPSVPGVSQASDAVESARCFENGHVLHLPRNGGTAGSTPPAAQQGNDHDGDDPEIERQRTETQPGITAPEVGHLARYVDGATQRRQHCGCIQKDARIP